jgi:hypothetical protein
MTNMAMQLPNGTKATNASKNMEVFGPHFHNVFNSHRSTDPTVLEHVQYEKVQIDDVVNQLEHLNAQQKAGIKQVLSEFTKLFDGTLGVYPQNRTEQLRKLGNS